MIGATVKAIRPMTSRELKAEGWSFSQWHIPTVIELSDGSILYPSQDEEGNGPGALFGVTSKGQHIVIA